MPHGLVCASPEVETSQTPRLPTSPHLFHPPLPQPPPPHPPLLPPHLPVRAGRYLSGSFYEGSSVVDPEADENLRRGKPLYLSTDRFHTLQSMVACHGVDHNSLVLSHSTRVPF
ncbi:unnamed protein product [Closterium sp. NIES-53]